MGFEPLTIKKNFFKKLVKSFGSSKISLTFASAFETKVFKEEFFERFRYEQASSTILTQCQKTETVNKLIDRFGS